MKRTLYLIAAAAGLWFTTSCGPQQQAKSVVKDFMEQNLVDAPKVRYLSFSDLDSTRTLGDSVLATLRAHAPGQFRRDMTYQPRASKTLLMTRVRYLLETDTLSTTFYLDPTLTGVVAVKAN